MLKPGTYTFGARMLQRRLRKAGIKYGLRSSYRKAGAMGLWYACLSQTVDVWSAMELFRRLYNPR